MSKTKKTRVAALDDIQEHHMKKVEAGETKILLVRDGKKVYAHAATCPHYGAPLEQGYLSGERIVCPWHHAAFDARSGELLEPPARDCIASYEVTVEGEDVYVHLPEKPETTRMPDMVKPDRSADSRRFVIVGAGAAANSAAQALRAEGYKGHIIMLTQDNHAPYDRPNLSKEYLQGNAEPEWMPLRDDSYFEENDIELRKATTVAGVNADKRVLWLKGGTEEIAFDRLLLAPGGVPRSLGVAGHDLDGVHTLRSWDDCDRIIAAQDDAKQIVVVGASFIGMEVAASLKSRGREVTVVAPEEVPFSKVFGQRLGRFVQEMHEKKGVRFQLGARVKAFEGDRKVKEVVLESGDRLPADLVVVGVGVVPGTKFIEGLDTLKDGSVAVDDHFAISEHIYAAGDVATFPFWLTDEAVRIEHWRTAEQLGRVAGHNMAGGELRYRGIPFFWTRQYDMSLAYVGFATEWDEIIVHGDIGPDGFLAFYVKDDQVRAAVGLNRGHELGVVEEQMRTGKMWLPQQLRDHDDITKLL
jgi:NADPH-dependent 2,4-dienoyl-CoA reductase/sulfur reductase-like enzyme/nitrite reductase/ring-hydroxylating ferredoxin subunit